jgi:hypothetical protein
VGLAVSDPGPAQRKISDPSFDQKTIEPGSTEIGTMLPICNDRKTISITYRMVQNLGNTDIFLAFLSL